MLWEVERTQCVDGLDTRGRDGRATRDHDEAADENQASKPAERQRVDYNERWPSWWAFLADNDITRETRKHKQAG